MGADRMKTITVMAAGLSCLLGFVLGPQSHAQESEVESERSPFLTGGFESDLANGYFWHGLKFSCGNVIQNSAWLSAAGFTLSLWSNLEPNAAAPTPDMNEVDVAFSYAAVLGPLNLEPAVNRCLYPEQTVVPNTVETSIRLSITLGSFEPYMLHTFDVKAYSGAYFGELGVAGSWPMTDNLTFESATEIGWGSRKFNEAYLEIAEPSVQLVQWDLALTWYPTNTLYVSPHAGLSAVTDKALREALDDPAIVQGGLRIGVDF